MNIGDGKMETEGVEINVSSSPSPSLVKENPMPSEVSRNQKRTIGQWIEIIKIFGMYTITCFAYIIINIFQNP